MLKAAARAYVPNARTNVLKLKTEFIEGLGDTVTVCIVGARYARRIGSGGESTLVCELACAAPTAAEAASAPSPAGPFEELTWLFNTASLSYKERATGGLRAADYEQLLRLLNEEIVTGVPPQPEPQRDHAAPLVQQGPPPLGQPLMRRFSAHEAPPSWLSHCPTSKDRRPHFVLIDPSRAVKVEVMGSRFLSRFSERRTAVNGTCVRHGGMLTGLLYLTMWSLPRSQRVTTRLSRSCRGNCGSQG